MRSVSLRQPAIFEKTLLGDAVSQRSYQILEHINDKPFALILRVCEGLHFTFLTHRTVAFAGSFSRRIALSSLLQPCSLRERIAKIIKARTTTL